MGVTLHFFKQFQLSSIRSIQLGKNWLFLSNILIIIGICCYAIRPALAFNKFCSVQCKNQTCNSADFGDCTQCVEPWVMNISSNKCQLPDSSPWAFAGGSTDIGGTISSNFNSTTACNSAIGGQYSYTYFGNLTGSNIIKFTHSQGIQVPHFEIRIIFWMILIDFWPSNAAVIVNLDSIYLTAAMPQIQVSQSICGAADSQDYLRFDGTDFHNSSSPFSFNLTTSKASSSKWGVKQLIILVRKCHEACTSCLNESSSFCYSCVPSMYLSGTICSSTCLLGFGISGIDNVCILCNSLCASCYAASENCTSCINNGTFSSFFVSYHNNTAACVSTCPSGMYTNLTDRICYQCNETLGFIAINGTCIYCPVANCTFCLEVNGAAVCQNCQPFFNLTINTKQCIQCSIPSCILCQVSNYCSACINNYTLGNGTCIQCNVDYCQQCISPNSCSSCIAPYITYNSSCFLCNVDNCQACSSDNICQVCASGYELKLDKCTRIVQPSTKSNDLSEYDRMVTIAIFTTCAFIVFAIVVFVIVLCYCKYKKKRGANKVQNDYREQTKADLMQFTSSRKFQTFKSIYRQNSQNNINFEENIRDSLKSQQNLPKTSKKGRAGKIRSERTNEGSLQIKQHNIKQLEQDKITEKIQFQIVERPAAVTNEIQISVDADRITQKKQSQNRKKVVSLSQPLKQQQYQKQSQQQNLQFERMYQNSYPKSNKSQQDYQSRQSQSSHQSQQQSKPEQRSSNNHSNECNKQRKQSEQIALRQSNNQQLNYRNGEHIIQQYYPQPQHQEHQRSISKQNFN